MSDASLTVKMSLDRLALKQGLEGATNDAKGFKDSFERSMRDTKGAVKDVAGSIDGIGRAFDGSVQGAVAGFKDLIGLVKTNPWLAFAAAAAGAATAVIKSWEQVQIAIEKAIDKSEIAAKAAQKARSELRGDKSPIEQEKAFVRDSSQQDIAARKERLRSESRDIDSAINTKLEDREYNIKNSYQKGVERDSAELEKLYNKREEIDKRIGALDDAAEQKMLKAAENRVEQHNKRVKEYEKEVEAKKKLESTKLTKEEEARQKTFKLFAGADEKLQDIFTKQRTSIFDNADVYQKIGGQVGRNLSPQLREANIRQQREKEMIDLAKDSAGSLADIKRTLSTALQQSEQL